MRMLVCVKQVPESEGAVSVEDYEEWIRRAPPSLFRMNRFDEYAVEEALRVKEACPDSRIDVISVGPLRCEAIIRRAMGMGADRGSHILTDDEPFLTPFATASWIAAWATSEQYDLIFAGVMSEDGMNGQVGPMLAEMLGVPCASSVVCARVTNDRNAVYVEREIESGFRDTLEMALPAVLTVQSGINQPRYPSLSNMLRARKAAIESIRADSLPGVVPREAVTGTSAPKRRRTGRVLEGSPSDKARELIHILRERTLVR
ncbi:MAG: electron transfer flavoprotein subunit beta/FixA family protein [Desulfomonile sp.]|nr:electron transfer flavoprotein subunit beta/FixA family protein [Desulfomonile sp.]